jgi:hypothetical protein
MLAEFCFDDGEGVEHGAKRAFSTDEYKAKQGKFGGSARANLISIEPMPSAAVI